MIASDRLHLAPLSLLLLAACSQGWTGTSSGGDDNLPILGAGPFAKPLIDFDTAAEEPYVVLGVRASLTEPSALATDDGGFRLWFSRQADDEDEVQIWTTVLPSVFELDLGQEAALVADQPWEEGVVRAPAVVRLEDGSYRMLYEGGMSTPGIGLASSSDGSSWDKFEGNPVIEGATRPGLGDARGSLMAVFTRPGDTQAIYAADSSDGGESWELRPDPILSTRPDTDEAFDATAVSSPTLFIRETVTGRLHYGLHFGGISEKDAVSIGYAASFDGESWERYLGPEPVVSNSPPAETGPSLVVEGTRALLFFSQPRQLRGAIAVGISP